jgi:hypothetical protein
MHGQVVSQASQRFRLLSSAKVETPREDRESLVQKEETLHVNQVAGSGRILTA